MPSKKEGHWISPAARSKRLRPAQAACHKVFVVTATGAFPIIAVISRPADTAALFAGLYHDFPDPFQPDATTRTTLEKTFGSPQDQGGAQGPYDLRFFLINLRSVIGAHSVSTPLENRFR